MIVNSPNTHLKTGGEQNNLLFGSSNRAYLFIFTELPGHLYLRSYISNSFFLIFIFKSAQPVPHNLPPSSNPPRSSSMHHLHHVSPSASAKQTQGHQKYIGNHYASCLALFYKFANYHLCHSPFPPWSPLSLSPLPLLLSPPSITTGGKVNFPSAFLFFSFLPLHPDDSQLSGLIVGTLAKMLICS